MMNSLLHYHHQKPLKSYFFSKLGEQSFVEWSYKFLSHVIFWCHTISVTWCQYHNSLKYDSTLWTACFPYLVSKLLSCWLGFISWFKIMSPLWLWWWTTFWTSLFILAILNIQMLTLLKRHKSVDLITSICHICQ